MGKNILSSLLLSALLLTLSGAATAEQTNELTFITLGTAGGPEADGQRAQPANAVVFHDQLYLVDVGDGAAAQLIKAGHRLPDLNGIFISHNHFDHTGGLMAVLGLRMQLNVHSPLTIYGPEGTRELVTGLLKAMSGPMRAAYGMPNQEWKALVDVVELANKQLVELNGLTVTVATNSHFAIPDAANQPEKAESLAFRFDAGGKSVVYTGDTGPSDAVVALASGADILVSEMMDIPIVLNYILKKEPNIPKPQLDGIEWHFRAHHLLPTQVGDLAEKAGVGKVVVTHMVPSIKKPEMAEVYQQKMSEKFGGKIVFANDLDVF
ncbi:MBL fold metallo-hydrolase [Alteromonas sp. NFXS44]|uniref:MBL fold metallo-hydrolase n=1 Tax=Alteromonas sp. NFXS44 TaxID=2818435 RepID=UPI0032E026A3